MNFTGLRGEINRMTGQGNKWVGDKQPMSYTPPHSHWRTRKEAIEKFLKVNKRGSK